MIGLELQVQGLHKTYPGNEHPVFAGLDLTVAAGTLCALVGMSGVGKTTLLNCVAALDRWDAGTLSLGGQSVPQGDPTAGSLWRRHHVGLAFQSPHLLPEFTVYENLVLPLLVEGEVSREQDEWIHHLLTTVGLLELVGRFPSQLSGGQAARVGLVRALVRKPGLWLLDEPTGNLDPGTAEEVFGFLLKLHADLRPTTLIVTHNPDLAARCERTVRLG